MIDAVTSADAAVIGPGPAGLAAALALAHTGLAVALVGALPDDASLARETRTTALFGGSIELLRHLGVWDALEADAAPLAGLRLVDDTGGLLRAPETLFRAREIGRTTFGFNVENARLIRILLTAVHGQPAISIHPEALARVEPDARAAVLTLASGARMEAALVIGADGRRSLCRAAASVTESSWTYPQSALATRFRHSRPHDGISTELHRRHGPLTTVPLPGSQSSLVWVAQPTEIERLAGLDEAAFAQELEARLHGLLGAITDVGTRAAFPLSGLSAKPIAQNRIALVGEAAHVLPPIGAQGLNLGFRDVAWIAEIAGEARARGEDIGGPAVLVAYAEARRSDVAARTLAVDLLNRSLFAGLLPADLARGAGLAMLNAVPALRRLVMREGIEPTGQRARLLNPATERA